MLALRSYNSALLQRPRDEEVLTSRAHVLLGMGRACDAVAGFDAALALTPGDEDLLAFRAAALAASEGCETG